MSNSEKIPDWKKKLNKVMMINHVHVQCNNYYYEYTVHVQYCIMYYSL